MQNKQVIKVLLTPLLLQTKIFHNNIDIVFPADIQTMVVARPFSIKNNNYIHHVNIKYVDVEKR